MAEIMPEKLFAFNLSQNKPTSKAPENPIIDHLAARAGLGSSNLKQKLPARLAEPKLYREYLNLEMGDTQQERERIDPSLIRSIKEEPDPIVIERLAKRAGLDLQKKEPIKEILSTIPTITTPEPVKSEKIFKDEAKWEKIIDEAPEEASPVNFKEAFKKARTAGMEKFEYKGNLFNTKRDDETKQEWARYLESRKIESALKTHIIKPLIIEGLTKEDRSAIRRTQNIAAYKKSITPTQSLLPKEVQEPASNFSAFMKETGIKIADKKDINPNEISSNLGPALNIISPILNKAGIIPEITSGKRGKGDWSLHEIGEAIDMRLKNASPEAINKIKENLPGKPISVNIHGEKGQLWQKDGFEFIIHGEKDNIHLHIERDTQKTKEALAEHLLKIGKKKNITRKGLRAYPELIQKYFPEG